MGSEIEAFSPSHGKQITEIGRCKYSGAGHTEPKSIVWRLEDVFAVPIAGAVKFSSGTDKAIIVLNKPNDLFYEGRLSPHSISPSSSVISAEIWNPWESCPVEVATCGCQVGFQVSKIASKPEQHGSTVLEKRPLQRTAIMMKIQCVPGTFRPTNLLLARDLNAEAGFQHEYRQQSLLHGPRDYLSISCKANTLKCELASACGPFSSSQKQSSCEIYTSTAT